MIALKGRVLMIATRAAALTRPSRCVGRYHVVHGLAGIVFRPWPNTRSVLTSLLKSSSFYYGGSPCPDQRNVFAD